MRELFTLLLFLITLWAKAQTSNDLSTGVSQLVLNKPTRSSTDNNTVERACIDEKLTGQCIQYHNDQWFSYIPADGSSFYINVRHERCKDGRGVQLVVFKGELCQTETYEIISCNSPATADDFYFKVNSPEPNVRYFMIIDGYLGDFCDFTIEVSDKANGLPVLIEDPLAEGILEVNEKMIELHWEYQPDTSEVSHFSVIRTSKTDNKRWQLPLAFNSRGGVGSEYLLKDTLTEFGKYSYEVYLVDANNEHRLYLHHQAGLTEPTPARENTTAFFPFDVRKNTNLQITITDAVTKRTLVNKFVKDYKLGGLQYDFQELIDRGHYFFEVRIYDFKSRRTETFSKRFEVQD
ncbi:hypothetical protein RT717_26655 [Imperialibacter roseus]|uniref:Uncharacterized protein n=1 Tax=Imperialibacter roseus TaxID=1324217 RepID=A0ABZ0IR71_9BACT|nr:hypothetical protein [Imperialibacter roseus]WOK06659.1 hypothetical protein RT717_26655 [Imperialibacter roseus]